MFYIYVYLDPRKPINNDIFDFEPFYVGRGSKNRLYHHLKEAKRTETKDNNLLKINKIRKILSIGMEPIVIKYYDNLTLDESISLEIKLISTIGKIIDGTGTLTNITDGGEHFGNIIRSGPFNSFYKKTHSAETKEKISKTHKGKTIPDETREKISKTLTGRKKHREFSTICHFVRKHEHEKNPNDISFQRLGNLKRKRFKVKSPDNQIIIVDNLKLFCDDNNIVYKTLLSAFHKNKSITSGWQILDYVD